MPKTEREKMLANELYWAGDAELAEMRRRARRLAREYNAAHEDEADRRAALITTLFGRLGPNAEIEPPFRCDYGVHVFAGEKLFLNFGCVILDCNEVHFGDNVLCGPYVQIYTAYHPIEPELRKKALELAAPVHIGHNVWIGGGAIVCPGVTIGDNAVIGAGSVVVKDIPANVVAVGNPCRVIREIKPDQGGHPRARAAEPVEIEPPHR